ncbi:MAG TPA: TraR/DksA family transcriptional regulator [Oligoflexia bacterium]|nr:TraR/DksA family transcriptional regulator [Oligoflexia bacterium]HMP26939.1 TraR/DksA family transcriptional regulator [Oligoflexia bacterium]
MAKSRKKELEELKLVLLDKRKKILEDLESLEQSSVESLEEISGDDADHASLEITQKSLTKLGTRQRKLLQKIDHALAKFEDDTYGICELTGEEIPIARLRARPEAQYTVEAKEELERKEKNFGGHSEDEDDLSLFEEGETSEE